VNGPVQAREEEGNDTWAWPGSTERPSAEKGGEEVGCSMGQKGWKGEIEPVSVLLLLNFLFYFPRFKLRYKCMI
jgi:hypothetical protein